MREFLKKYNGYVVLFVLVAVVTHLEGNVAMIAGEITAVWAAIVLVKVLIYGVSWLIRREVYKIERFKKAAIRFVYMAVLSAVSWQGIQFIHWKIARDFAPLIEKIEVYHVAHGEYPKSLEGLVAHVPTCGMAPLSYVVHSRDGTVYSCRDEGSSKCMVKEDGPVEQREFYVLTCMTFGFNHHSYLSKSGEWSDGD